MDTLEEVYAALPRIRCRGLCFESCGPVAAQRAEVDAIEQRTGAPIKGCGDGGYCAYLSRTRRCTIYDLRSMVCRAYGVAEGLLCEFGCEPERVLTDDEMGVLLKEAERIGGETVPFDPAFYAAVLAIRRAGLSIP